MNRTSELLTKGRGNPIWRLHKLAGRRCSLRYDYFIAALVNERRAQGKTYAVIAEEFLLTGVRSFRGRMLSSVRLGQIARTFPTATRAKELAIQEV